MLSAAGISPNYWLRCSALIPPSVSATFSLLSQVSTLYSSSSFNCFLHSKHKYIRRASSEGLPNELVQDSKFVPLNADDPTYGPPALLLLGFDADEGLKIQQLLKELDGEFMKVIYCTEDMVTSSLWEAVNTTQPSLEKIKDLSHKSFISLYGLSIAIDKSLPRICFLSGLSGEEMMMFIDAFAETGLKPAVFAALVPNSVDKSLQEVIEEIMGDHEILTSEQPYSD